MNDHDERHALSDFGFYLAVGLWGVVISAASFGLAFLMPGGNS